MEDAPYVVEYAKLPPGVLAVMVVDDDLEVDILILPIRADEDGETERGD